MSRYFIEVSYLGTAFAGFQIQENAMTVQGELEMALTTILRRPVGLTGSSRTDAGVHAIQNYFHFDEDEWLPDTLVYNLNALLHNSISVKRIVKMQDQAHSRFDASGRQYQYSIHHLKNPFLNDRSYYFPYPLDFELLQNAATILVQNTDFSSFSKKGTQAKTPFCQLEFSKWEETDLGVLYHVKGNRFLRGMVRGMVGTMLKLGRNKISLQRFQEIVDNRDQKFADFAVPGHGLTLMQVEYPSSMGL